MQFKMGDIVKIKKLSNKEYDETYSLLMTDRLNYADYLISYKDAFNTLGKIKSIEYVKNRFNNKDYWKIFLESKAMFYFPNELIKINYLANKIKKIKRLISNDKI